MRHDQVFKILLESFLREFLELFFPDVAERLDFSTQRLLDKEVFTDFPEGQRREADVVAELRTWEGEPELVLVHVEVQADTEPDFGRRMYAYYSMLRLRYRIPVFPVALYLKGGSSMGSSEYRETLFGWDVVEFHYASVALQRLVAEEYVERGALAASLAALMRRAGGPEGIALRVRMVRELLDSDLDEARRSLLGYVIASYYPISEEELEKFKQVAEKEGSADMPSMDVNWADQLRLDGLTEGIARGKRETLKRLLAAKFGPLTKEIEVHIDAVESSEELDGYLDRVLTANTVDDIGIGK